MRRRVVLVLLFAIAFLAAFGVSYAWKSGSDDEDETAVAASTTKPPDTTVPRETTLDLPTTSTGPAETTVAETVPAETTQAPTTTAGVESRLPDLGSSGAFVQADPNQDRRIPEDNTCGFQLLAEPDDCGDLSTSDGVIVKWVRSSSGFEVFHREGADGEEFYVRDLATSVVVDGHRVVDVSGDGAPDLVIGYRNGDTLQVDVVDVSNGPAVSLHLRLRRGSVRVSEGQLDTWTFVPELGTFDHWVLRQEGGGWQVVDAENVTAGAVPPSQL